MRRRVVAAVLAASVLAGCSDGDERADPPPRPAGPPTTSFDAGPPETLAVGDVTRRLAALERRRDARLGVYAVDVRSGRSIAYRAGSRFAHASTFKVLAVGMVLDRLGVEALDRRLTWTEADLVGHSPVTSRHVADGLTLAEVMDAAVTQSDGTAGNLLLGLLGGPDGLEDALRAIGDDVTSVDRPEPDLTSAIPGDTRDTTTPRALAGSFVALTLDSVLQPEARDVLNRMLERSTTGIDLVRAVVPDDWTVGDKTGTAAYGGRNVVAVVRPPDRGPVVVAVMTTHSSADAQPDDRLVADAARIVLGR